MAVAKGTSADGSIELKAFFKEGKDGLKVKLSAKGLQPGAVHGIHVHENGVCNAPDYTSAGAHFDPTGENVHGAHDAEDSHLGDLGNLTANDEGVAKRRIKVKGATTTEGSTNFVGRALILHVGPDDLTTQPAGDSGARLVCAVINTPDEAQLKEWKKGWKDGKKGKKGKKGKRDKKHSDESSE